VEPELTLHSSWRGIIASFAGGVLLLVIGVLNLVYRGVDVVSVGFATIGALVLVGLAFDYPIASSFDGAGVTRRALARRKRIEWGGVRQLSRTRGSGLRAATGTRLGGLVAIVGRRRYLLVDQVESGAEYDDLERLLGELAARLEIDLVMRPGDEVAPTWLYRRRRWRMES
jgi:hypothetical protein